ncbi:MAG: hypothetical protein HYT63_03515 [Candidatus Yanofskybacteria bacterium]|nr:hypothetical protein [Candidatus Yanofskybacteria bacterium]
MKYVPYIVLALFVAVSGVASFNSHIDTNPGVFVNAEANIFDSVLSWFGVVDLSESSAKGGGQRRDTGPAPLRPECIAWSSLWGPNPCGGDNANSTRIEDVLGNSGQCVSPRAADFTNPPNPGDPEPNAVRNTSTNAQGVSYEDARSSYFQCLVRNQQTGQTTTTTIIPAIIPRVNISGKVTGNSGEVLANVEVFDNDRVVVMTTGNTIPEPAVNALVGATFTPELNGLTPGNWTICADGNNFGPTGMSMYMGEMGNIPFTATSTNTGFFRLTLDDFLRIQGTPDSNGFVYDVGYLTRGERSSDFVFFSVDIKHPADGPPPSCSTTVAGGSRTEYQNRSGQGTLKIGETNSAGDVVFGQEFVDFLKNTIGETTITTVNGVNLRSSVEVSNGGRTIKLPANIYSIPGGLTARYEYQGSEGLITKTKEITASNGLMDFSVQMTGGDVGDSENLTCNLVWDNPKTDDGDGIRRIGERSNVRILLSGFSPNQTVVIKNTNLNNRETRSAPVTVNAQGGFDVYDRTPIRRDEYKVGTYKTEIVDSNQNVLAECDNSFIIKAPIVTKKPKIKSFSPLAGKIGDTIVFKGSNFSLDENKVWLDENYFGPFNSDNGSLIEFNIESFSNLFFAENSFAFRVGVENNGGVISKPASNWLTIYQEGEEGPLTIESVSPFSLKAGRVASLSVVGKNLSTIKEVYVSGGDVNLVDNSLRITNLGRQRNRVRFKLNVDPNTEPGFYDVVLSGGTEVDRTIGFKIEILPVRVTQESTLNRFLSRFGVKVQLEKGFAEEP